VAQVLLLSLIMLSPALISFISSGGDGKLVVDSMWIAFYWLSRDKNQLSLNIGTNIAKFLGFFVILPSVLSVFRYFE
jgi:hypothetical protein